MHIMLQLLDALLAPLARLMVARGVPFPDFAERMKAHFVAAAMEQADRKPTDSRLSVMTGLQRRDVARLRDAPPRSERVNHLSNLIARWRTKPDYAGGPIPRTGEAPSFDALARDIRRDIHPRTMLDTLIAAGTVELDDTDTVILRRSSYQPLPGSDAQISYLAHNLGDHIAAATENVMGRDSAHFERAVHYTGLTAQQVTDLEQMHAEGQMTLFETLAHHAARMKAEDENGPERFRAGAYFYRAETEDN